MSTPQRRRAAKAVPDILAALEGEHRYQARLLKALEEQVGLLNQEQEPDVEMLWGVMHYMTHFPDRYHHPKEDLIFERLAARDPAAQPALKKLLDAHRSISDAGARLFGLIEQQRGDTPDPELWPEIRIQAKDYVKSLRLHMDMENRHMFPRALAGLQEDDWREIDARMKPILDPVFSEQVADEYQTLHERYVNEEKQVSLGRTTINLMEVAALIEAITALIGGINRIRVAVREHNRGITRENRERLAQWSSTPDREARRELMQLLLQGNRERAAAVTQRVQRLWDDARTAAADPYDPRHGEHGPRWLRPRQFQAKQEA
jgi:hemerythrin-like domain-containing protein